MSMTFLTESVHIPITDKEAIKMCHWSFKPHEHRIHLLSRTLRRFRLPDHVIQMACRALLDDIFSKCTFIPDGELNDGSRTNYSPFNPPP